MTYTDQGNSNTVEYPSEFTQSVQEATNGLGNQQAELAVDSDFNFWEVNNYKRTVRRVDDGAKLCEDFMKMVSERAEIEAQYSSRLQGWSKKWYDLISKGPEYGTCKTSWLNIPKEAEELAQIHIEVQGKILSQVYESIVAWKVANYHKSLLNWKETKNAEEGFSKAQKPWTKKYDEVMKCKKSYYGACRAHDLAEKSYNDSTTESSTLTEEQVKKLKDKVTKCERDLTTTQDKYKEAVRDITNYNPKYKDDMCFAFDKLQMFEESRKRFFNQTMQSYCQVVAVQPYFERFSHIYNSLSNEFEKTEPTADITWWAANYGTDMLIKWLEYEEYAPANDSQPPIQQRLQGQTDAKPPAGNSSGSPKKERSSVCTTI